MQRVSVPLSKKVAEGYIIPLGPANLVAVITDTRPCRVRGIRCRSTRFVQLPAAKVRPAHGPSIVNTEDIMNRVS